MNSSLQSISSLISGVLVIQPVVECLPASVLAKLSELVLKQPSKDARFIFATQRRSVLIQNLFAH